MASSVEVRCLSLVLIQRLRVIHLFFENVVYASSHQHLTSFVHSSTVPCHPIIGLKIDTSVDAMRELRCSSNHNAWLHAALQWVSLDCRKLLC